MPITHIEINGYRTLRKLSWHPGELNVVIGPNGTGKSNLLKFLRLIRSAATGDLQDSVLSEGGMGSITWNGADQTIGFTVKGQIDQSGAWEYSVSLKRIGNSASFVITNELLVPRSITEHLSASVPHETVAVIRRLAPSATVYVGGDRFDEFASSELNGAETVLSALKGPGSTGLIRECAATLGSWSIHNDLHTEFGSVIRYATTSRHDERLDDDGQNLATVLHTFYENDRDFQEYVDVAMTAAFGSEYHGLAFPPAGSQQIELAVRWKSLKRPQTAAALSDGTLRFLFLITAFALPKLPSLLCIDEPETGLHPSMLPIVAEYAANASLKTQVVLTTHSVQFLDAFRDQTPITTVAQLYEGETKLTTLDTERLVYWLSEYSLGSLFRSGELENMAEDVLEDADRIPEVVDEDTHSEAAE